MAPAVFDNDGTLWAEVGTRGKGDVSTGPTSGIPHCRRARAECRLTRTRYNQTFTARDRRCGALRPASAGPSARFGFRPDHIARPGEVPKWS